MKLYAKLIGLAVFTAGCMVQTTQADTLRIFDATSSPDELAEFLFPSKKVKTRGLVVEPEKKNVAAMHIRFEFDSSRLTIEAVKAIEVLAGALKNTKSKDGRMLIEGHTDSIGSDRYNMDLSERRANAVKSFLVQAHGISSERLFTRGMGESELLDTQSPSNELNRRVEFMRVM